MIYSLNIILLVFYRLNGDIGFVVPLLGEFNFAIDHCIQGVVFADPYVAAGMMYGTPLPDQNITGPDYLASVEFHTQSLAL